MRVPSAILWGSLTVGTIDCVDAIVSALQSHAAPMRVFQGVAYGLLGRDTYRWAAASFALGTAIHYFIALCIVATFMGASRVWPVLARRPSLTGPILRGRGLFFYEQWSFRYR